LSREELKKLNRKPVMGRGTVLQIIPAGEKSGAPKMLLVDVKIEGIEGTIHHMWVTPKKDTVTKRKRIAFFTGIVREYNSIDKDGNAVVKYGINHPKKISRIKAEVEEVFLKLKKSHNKEES
jgi:hypothetical protein